MQKLTTINSSIMPKQAIHKPNVYVFCCFGVPSSVNVFFFLLRCLQMSFLREFTLRFFVDAKRTPLNNWEANYSYL